MGIDVAAFWLAIAAVIVAWTWRRRHTEALRHETLRVMIQKNEVIDEKLLSEILNPPAPDDEWRHVAKPGSAYRVFRFLGTLIMIASPGVGIITVLATYFEEGVIEGDILAPVGFGAGMVTLIAGLAFFVAARFLEKPQGD